MEKPKISFDFDSTLAESKMERLAHELNKLGVELYITTSRLDSEAAPSPDWNDDLFATADRLGIPKERITFTHYADKTEFLEDQDFLIHIDDDPHELDLINQLDDPIIGIQFEPKWSEKEIEINTLKSVFEILAEETGDVRFWLRMEECIYEDPEWYRKHTEIPEEDETWCYLIPHKADWELRIKPDDTGKYIPILNKIDTTTDTYTPLVTIKNHIDEAREIINAIEHIK